MVLDLRAQILCNLGPVISGSIRDDHIQGQGLIYTTGELVIAGLITQLMAPKCSWPMSLRPGIGWRASRAAAFASPGRLPTRSAIKPS